MFLQWHGWHMTDTWSSTPNDRVRNDAAGDLGHCSSRSNTVRVSGMIGRESLSHFLLERVRVRVSGSEPQRRGGSL